MRMDRSPSRLARRLLMLALAGLPTSALAVGAAPADAAGAAAATAASTPAPPGLDALLAHAGRDERVPMAQYEALVAGLEAAGRPPEVTIVKPNEGHGFSDPANQREFYEALLAFLDRHIGEGRAAAPAAAPAASAGAAE